MSTASPPKINCNAAATFQMDLEVPALTTGVLGTPALGVVTGVTLRLSATEYGVAIDPAVGNLAASERSAKAGRFAFEVNQTLMQSHVLPLGKGKRFYAIWSKPGEFDDESIPYVVAVGTSH